MFMMRKNDDDLDIIFVDFDQKFFQVRNCGSEEKSCKTKRINKLVNKTIVFCLHFKERNHDFVLFTYFRERSFH